MSVVAYSTSGWKEKGFNEEDETKINDVAKVLGTIDVALLDNEGNWRDMSDIFSDVAAKWDTLSGKQKSYIATVLAGTRQQNAFLALMSDMVWRSKPVVSYTRK